MEKLAGDLLLGLKFVKLEILSTSFIDFLYSTLGELSNSFLHCDLPGKGKLGSCIGNVVFSGLGYSRREGSSRGASVVCRGTRTGGNTAEQNQTNKKFVFM